MIQIGLGVYLFKNKIDAYAQDKLAQWYQENKKKFYRPISKWGGKMSIDMNCLGWHWDATDNQYYKVRTDVDREDVEFVPDWLVEMAKPFSLEAFPLHNPSWDISIWNHYRPGKSKLGLHVDNSETERSRGVGHPVVSFSVGASCKFNVGWLKRKDPVKEVQLDSGDVLVFGGPGRMIYHGVAGVMPYEKEDEIGAALNGGRLNITLRKM